MLPWEQGHCTPPPPRCCCQAGPERPGWPGQAGAAEGAVVGAAGAAGAGTGSQPQRAYSCCSATRETQHVGNAAARSWRGCCLTHVPHPTSPAGTVAMCWHNTAHPTGRLDQSVLEAWHVPQVHTASKAQALKPHCFYCFAFKDFSPSGYKEYFQSMKNMYSPASLGRAQTTLP